MEPFANVGDLADTPGVDLTDVSEAQQWWALQQATTTIIGELRWDPRESERTMIVRATCYGRVLVVPAMHVTALAVTADDVVLEAASVFWDDNGVLRLDRAVSTLATITYTAGWPPEAIPEALRDACLMLAADLLDNPRRLASWKAEDTAESFTGYNPASDQRLDAYRMLAIA